MKGPHVVVEGGAAAPQPQQQTGRLSGTPLDALGHQTYLTVAQAADYTCRPSVNAFRKWAYAACLPPCRMGRSVLYRRRDIDDAVNPQSKKFAHRRVS